MSPKKKCVNGGYLIQKADLATQIFEKLGNFTSGVSAISSTHLLATVEASRIIEVAQKLDAMGFDHVKSVTGIDFPEENKIEIVYHVSSFENPELEKVILELKTTTNRTDPRISSLIDIWPSSEYPERETQDLMGVIFEGQPPKERLMLMDNFEGGPPLRKDFKLKTEGIDA